MQKYLKSSGFSLIEIMIVMLVMSIIFGVGYTNYRDFSRRKILESAASRLEGDLKLAQEFAYASKKPEVGCDALDGYSVVIDSVNDLYGVYADCSNDNLVSIGRDAIDLGSSIDLDANVDSVTFKILGQGTNLISNMVVGIQLVQSSDYTGEVTISPGGEVTYQQINVLGPTSTPVPTSTGVPSSTPVPTNTPSPTPTISTGGVEVKLNSATGLNCINVCSGVGKNCTSVGVDSGGTDGKKWVISGGACKLLASGCDQYMGNHGSMCSGQQAKWTKCRCQ